MRDFLKNFASLIVALIFLLGILFLPSDTFIKVNEFLKFISRTDTAAFAFGNYLIQKAVTGAIILVITLMLTIIAHRVYKGISSSTED